jgi:hypothetical protein
VKVSHLRVDNKLIVRQSPACKNVSTVADGIVGIRQQASTGEDIANREDFMYAVATEIFAVCKSVILS